MQVIVFIHTKNDLIQRFFSTLKWDSFILDAGENRAEEEVMQLETRGWDCMLWTMTSRVWIARRNFVHCHSARTQQILCHTYKGTMCCFSQSWQFTDFQTRPNTTVSPKDWCFFAALSCAGGSGQHPAAWKSEWQWTFICSNAGVICHSSSGPCGVAPQCCKYRFRLNTDIVHFEILCCLRIWCYC